MTYFPDYRKETDKLNDVDEAFIRGSRKALADIKCFFDNINDKNALTVEKEVTAKVKASLGEWMECEEIETVCWLFDGADYLPEDIELVDANSI